MRYGTTFKLSEQKDKMQLRNGWVTIKVKLSYQDAHMVNHHFLHKNSIPNNQFMFFYKIP